MGIIKKSLIIGGLSLVLITLVAGLFGYIRYDQLSRQRELAKQDRDMVVKEYKWKLMVDSKTIGAEIGKFIEVLNKRTSLKKNPEFAHALNQVKDECEWSLKGLSGKVSSAIRYEKDLRLPDGASPKKHEQYRRSIQGALLILNEIGKKETLTPEETDNLIKRLQNQADKIKETTSRL